MWKVYLPWATQDNALLNKDILPVIGSFACTGNLSNPLRRVPLVSISFFGDWEPNAQPLDIHSPVKSQVMEDPKLILVYFTIQLHPG